jgi:hypothetical protein
MSTCNMTWYDMWMWVGQKMLVKYRMHMTVQIWSLINFSQKIPQFTFILKTTLFSVWVPISKERKTNRMKPYLRVLMRIAESLYSGGRTPWVDLSQLYHQYQIWEENEQQGQARVPDHASPLLQIPSTNIQGRNLFLYVYIFLSKPQRMSKTKQEEG